MRLHFLLLTVILHFPFCSWAQTEKPAQAQQEIILPSAEQLLPARTYTVDIMDKVRMDPRFMILSQKLQEAARKDPSLFIQLQKEAAASKGPLPYDSRLGLSKAEYDELQMLVNKRDARVEASSSEEVVVTKEKGTIRFSSKGKLSILNNVWIDLTKNEAHIAEYTLPFIEKVSVAGDDNAYGTSWSGYKWEYDDAKNFNLEDLDPTQLKSLNMTLFNLVVGKLDNSGKTVVKLKGTHIENGTKKFSFDTPLFF